MNEALKTVLSLSCSATLLIVLLVLLRPVLRAHLSKQWQYYIWLVVAVRLLVPFAAAPNLMGTFFQGIGNGIGRAEYSLPVVEDTFSAPAYLNDGERVQDYFSKEQKGAEAGADALSNKRTMFWIWNNLGLCWLVTALILLIRKITIYQSFVKYVRAGCVQVTDFDLLESFGRLVEQCKVKMPVELYTNSLISSPILIGFFRPCIVLPTAGLSVTAFQYIILHELTHYKRRDMFYKWLIQLIVCIHWFNPFIRLMNREVELSCELSCDEAILKGLNRQERCDYGDTLLNALENSGGYKSATASVTLGESGKQLKERLDAITGFRRKSKSARMAAVFLTLFICLGGAAAGAYAAPASGRQAKPSVIGALTLNEKEFTVDELKASGISELSLVTYSDYVSVVCGGNTLKFEYYGLDEEEYVFREMDFFEKACVLSVSRPSSDIGEARSMTITLPENFQFDAVQIKTTSGNIDLRDCIAGVIRVETQNGQINIRGGAVSRNLEVNTQTGDVLISGTVLPDGEKNASYVSTFHTVSGTVIVQSPDSAENYCLSVDYGEEAEIFINDECYEEIEMPNHKETEAAAGQDEAVNGVPTEFIKKLVFTMNEDAPKKLRFDSLQGTLIIQEE